MKKSLFVTTALLGAVSFTCLAAETVYKWTDESGVVHFSDRPVPNAAAEEMRVTSSVPDLIEEDEGEADAEEEDAASKAPASREEQQAAMEEQRRKVREQNCQIARQTLEHNGSIERMYRVDANGERVFLSDEEREMVLGRSREDVEKWCD
ncbi:MAG: DUF4124 domain-containing protein [Gammaproteobacteria bacterium]|nr:DUF4124 domain-containing protein [Gammaproteobacteria bacterium]